MPSLHRSSFGWSRGIPLRLYWLMIMTTSSVFGIVFIFQDFSLAEAPSCLFMPRWIAFKSTIMSNYGWPVLSTHNVIKHFIVFGTDEFKFSLNNLQHGSVFSVSIAWCFRVHKKFIGLCGKKCLKCPNRFFPFKSMTRHGSCATWMTWMARHH